MDENIPPPEKTVKPANRPGSLRIDFPDDSGADEDGYRRHIKNQLSKDEMPVILRESGRLVAEGESAAGDLVIAYVRKVLDKLSLARTGKPGPALKIFLSDQSGVNTGVITKAKTPVLIAGLGMIDKILKYGFGEDELAPIFGHERFHLRRHEKWKDMQNGRPEETVADVWGVMEAADAGYNPQGLGRFFRALQDEIKTRGNEKSQDWGNVLRSMIDEHPKMDDRIRTSENVIANLQLTKRMTETLTPIPAEVIEAAAQVKFMSPWDRHKQENNFDAATPAKKVDLIAQYMDTELGKREGYKEPLSEELLKLFEQINRTPPAGTAKPRDNTEPDPWLMSLRLAAALDDLLLLKGAEVVEEAARKQLYAFASKDIGRNSQGLEGHYLWILEQFIELQSTAAAKEDYFYKEYRQVRIGEHNHRGPDLKTMPADLLRLKTTAEAFWSAKTKEEALKAAMLYEQAVRELAPCKPGIDALKLHAEPPQWPHRKEIRAQLAKKGYARLPWENQIQWALSSSGDEGELLKRTATNLGCPDQRLPSQIARPHFYYDDPYSIYDLTLNAAGDITALTLSGKELKAESQKRFKAKTAAELFQREYNRQRTREAAEEALVQAADWAGMERNFWGFVAEHAVTLAPDSSVAPGKSPFAAAFINRLQALRKADPAKWEQDYAAFLTGTFPDGRNKDKYGDVVLQVNSLPYLIQVTGEIYLGPTKAFDYSHSRSFKGTRGALPKGHPLSGLLGSFHDVRQSGRVSYNDKKTGRWVSYNRKPRPVPPAHEQVELAIRIDTGHPYVRALLALDKKYLTSGRKGSLLSHFRYENPETAEADRFFTISPRAIFNYAACRTAHAVNSLEKRVTGDLNDQHHMVMSQVEMLEFLKALRRLDRAQKDERFSISEMSLWQVAGGFHFLHDPQLEDKLLRERAELINRQLERNCRADFAGDVSLKTLISRFIADHGGKEKSRMKSNNIFATRPELEKRYLQHIRRRVMNLSPARRVVPLEQLMALQLENPGYRSWAVSRWVDAVALSLGKDQGDPDYAVKTLERVKSSVKKMDAAQGIHCVTALLEKIEAQRAVALGAKEILTEAYGRQFLEKDGAMRLIESAVSTCAEQPDLRRAFLKYITGPLSKSGTNAFISAIKKSLPDAKEYSVSSDFIKKFYDPHNNVLVSREQERMIVDSLHQNIWAMPFEMRTVYLDRILFPVGQEKPGEFDQAVSFVLDKVLPPERKFSEQAREALKVYLDCCPMELRRVSFSAILATTRRAKGKTLRLGQVLSYVFARTGAAGGQLLQAAHSYLSGIEMTDPDLIQLRDDLKSSKVDFQRPFRWEIFERMDEALPEAARQSVKRVGSLLGCGSTAYVVATEKTPIESALKLMRKDVMPIADLQFERYGQAFTKLAELHSHYAPLPGMVDHARQMIKVSAQGTVAAKQVAYAQDSYDPVTVSVNGEKYGFKVAPALSCGPEYLETALVTGTHLNDLETASKKNPSIAAEAIEIYRMLQGRAIDQDRHGYQQKIQPGHMIGIFDVGALPFDAEKGEVSAPSDSEKRALGRLLGLTLNAALAGKPPVEELVNAVTTRRWGDAKPYLVGIKRGLLARMDIHAGLGVSSEERAHVLSAIFTAALRTGRIDPMIFRGISEAIDLKTCRHLATLAINGERPAAAIAIEDSSISAATPKLSLSSALAIFAKTGIKRAFNRAGLCLEQEKPDDAPAPAPKADMPPNAPPRT